MRLLRADDKKDAAAVLRYLQYQFLSSECSQDALFGGFTAVQNVVGRLNFSHDREMLRLARDVLLAMLVPEAFEKLELFQAPRLKDITDLGVFCETIQTKNWHILFLECFSALVAGMVFCRRSGGSDILLVETPTVLLLSIFVHNADFSQQMVTELQSGPFASAFAQLIEGALRSKSVRNDVEFFLKGMFSTVMNMVLQGNESGMHFFKRSTNVLRELPQGNYTQKLAFVGERMHSQRCYSDVNRFMRAESDDEERLLDCVTFFAVAAHHPESATELDEIGVFMFILDQLTGPDSVSKKFHEEAAALFLPSLLRLTTENQSKYLRALNKAAERFPDLDDSDSSLPPTVPTVIGKLAVSGKLLGATAGRGSVAWLLVFGECG